MKNINVNEVQEQPPLFPTGPLVQWRPGCGKGYAHLAHQVVQRKLLALQSAGELNDVIIEADDDEAGDADGGKQVDIRGDVAKVKVESTNMDTEVDVDEKKLERQQAARVKAKADKLEKAQAAKAIENDRKIFDLVSADVTSEDCFHNMI